MRSHALATLMICAALGCTDKQPVAPKGCDTQPCAAGAVWSSVSCACQTMPVTAGAMAGATAICPGLQCPTNAPPNLTSCMCQGPEKVDCELEPELAKRVSKGDVVDCGMFQSDSPFAARQQAQQCVLDALAAQHAFKVMLSVQGTDSRDELAYTWQGDSTLVSILGRSVGLTGYTGPSLHEETCRTLRAAPDCNLASGTLCLLCSDRIETSLVCGGADPKFKGECRGVGNYETGKEGGYRPCCPGLREVFQHSSATTDNDRHICSDPPLRVSACVEGQCGDGRCEEPEAVPCGCTLDCPSAIWEAEDAGVSGP